MLPLKIILSLYLLLLVVSCNRAPDVEPTSTLEPVQVEEMTSEKQLAKKMFTSMLTRLPNGMLSAVIQAQKNDKTDLRLKMNHLEKTLHELCRTQENCVGGVYSSVHNHKGKGEIMHRIFKGKRLQIACAWIEHYPSEFDPMNEQLEQDVIGRSWHWVKECFEI